MHNELLQHSPLLLLPLVAMFAFLGIWVVAAVRVLTRSAEEMADAARMPLEGEVRRERH
ncbi:MAG: hypothetical protein ABSF69_21415 [Polyangiaceae bacterium]|jgi:formate dehydrogenase assembly factor FdhD